MDLYAKDFHLEYDRIFSIEGNSWFIFELTLRFLVAPSKRQFCRSILTWIGKVELTNLSHSPLGIF